MRLIILYFLLFFCFTANVHAQDKRVDFPENFIGHWKGKLNWVRARKATQQFSMQLKIARTDSADIYSWTIIYGDSSKDERPYILTPVDKSKNHWIIDERNGIILDNYVAGNCFQGIFTVSGNTILDNYCIEYGKMSVQFFAIKMADKTTTGKGTEDSPTVDSYRMSGYQYGLLEKVN